MSNNNSPATPEAAPVDENQLIAERREKLKAIRARQAQGQGVAFPNDFKPAHHAATLHELHGEKIDIVDWSEDPAEFVRHALSPAKVNSVEVIDEVARAARVIVPDYQLSLAIGKEGQNARLAARLTGWRIDIRSDMAPDQAIGTRALPEAFESAP